MRLKHLSTSYLKFQYMYRVGIPGDIGLTESNVGKCIFLHLFSRINLLEYIYIYNVENTNLSLSTPYTIYRFPLIP